MKKRISWKIIRCENCELLYKIKNTPTHPQMFYLRLKYSKCPHCHHPRTNEKVGPGQFQCKKCRVIYTLTVKRHPIGGICQPCWTAKSRKKKKLTVRGVV